VRNSILELKLKPTKIRGGKYFDNSEGEILALPFMNPTSPYSYLLLLF